MMDVKDITKQVTTNFVDTYSNFREFCQSEQYHHKNKEKVKPLKWAYEPKQLRFFTGRFEPK